jgi:hypothetical protein
LNQAGVTNGVGDTKGVAARVGDTAEGVAEGVDPPVHETATRKMATVRSETSLERPGMEGGSVSGKGHRIV